MEKKERLLPILKQARDLWRQDHKAAYARYDDLLQQYPGCAIVLREYGKAVLSEHDDYDKAVTLLEQALKAEPNALLTWLYLGLVYDFGYGQGYPAAVDAYRYIIAHFPAQTQACVAAYLRIGMDRQAPGVKMSIQEAVDCFRQAIKLDPQSPEAYQCLAQGLYDEGDWQGAYEALEKAIHLREQRKMPYEHLLDRLRDLKERRPLQTGMSDTPDIAFHWPDEELE